MYVCTYRYTQYDTRHEQGGIRKVTVRGAPLNTTYELAESKDLANILGMNKRRQGGLRPYDFSIFRCDGVAGDFKRFKKILENLLANAMNLMIKAILCSRCGPTSAPQP
jgi:hypothetical protein